MELYRTATFQTIYNKASINTDFQCMQFLKLKFFLRITTIFSKKYVDLNSGLLSCKYDPSDSMLI